MHGAVEETEWYGNACYMPRNGSSRSFIGVRHYAAASFIRISLRAVEMLTSSLLRPLANACVTSETPQFKFACSLLGISSPPRNIQSMVVFQFLAQPGDVLSC
jgi:hypothetical protein